MFKEMINTLRLSRQEDPEKFKRRFSKFVVGISVSALMVVAAVNVASVITVFPF